LGRVLGQVAQEDARFRDRPGDDRPGMRGQVQRLAHRPERGLIFWRELGEIDRRARINQRCPQTKSSISAWLRASSASAAGVLNPLTETPSRDRLLSDQEITEFWQACHRIGSPFGPYFSYC
jgi:hypothetical protein